MSLKRFCMYIATLGPVGYLIAPGTVSTLLTLPLVYWTHMVLKDLWLYAGLVIGLFAIGVLIISKALYKSSRHQDPSEIVFDEFVACFLVFWGISMTTQSMVVGFLLFRALDIIKIGWIKKTEELVGAWGVMSDDIIAAGITNIVLRFLFS